jgi:hypothetical protein
VVSSIAGYRLETCRDTRRVHAGRTRWHVKKYDIPDNVRREPRQERSQLTLRARLLKPNFHPFRRDTRT